MDDYLRKLIYKDRKSIKDFDIDVIGSLDKLLYENYLAAVPELLKFKKDFNSHALEVFNDTYYVCTTVLSQTNTILELSYYIERVQIPSVVLPMAYGYLLKLKSDSLCVKRIMAFIDGEAKNESAWENNLEIIRNLDKKVKKYKLSESTFAFRKITPELLTEINWPSVTQNFDIDTILKIVRKICNNEEDWRMVLEAIKNAASNYEWNYNNELSSGDYYDDEIGQWCHYKDKPIDLSNVCQYCDELKEKNNEFPEHNLFAPTILLKRFLNEEWFDSVSADSQKFTKVWRENMVDALMSEYGLNISSDWMKSKKRLMIKMSLIGALKDVGVLKSKSYQYLVNSIYPDSEIIEEKLKETLAKYMGYGKKDCYFDWLKNYVTPHNHEESE